MKAMLCEAYCHYSALTYCDVPEPVLRPGTVRIAVHYATCGFGQILVIAGKYQRKPPLPFVPGTEVAGVVIEVAGDVTTFAVGDRVAASLDWGGYAEQAIATAATTWKVPNGIDLATAATVPLTYGTAYAALHWRAKLQAGETLLVHGAAGGVGLPAVEIGRLAGANVIAVAGSQERLSIAMEHGARHGIVHGGDEPLSRRVIAVNGGSKVNVVFDTVGGDLFHEALRSLQPEGRILLIGFASDVVPQIPANLLLVKNAQIIGFWFGLYLGWGQTDERQRYETRLRAMMTELFEHIGHGRLSPVSSALYPLAELERAFDAVAQRKAVGRALVRIDR